MAVSGPRNTGGGTGGGAIVETGSPGSPQVVTSNITVPTDIRARLFVKGDTGGTLAPTIDDGAEGQELFLYGVSDADFVELESGGNLEVEGKMRLKNGSQGILHWSVARSKWKEAGRNNV